jgi:hypothetical protein
MALDTVGGALFEPVLRSVRFAADRAQIYQPRAEFGLDEIYRREVHVTGLASVFLDGAHVARRLRPTPSAVSAEACLPLLPSRRGRSKTAPRPTQTVVDGAAGIKQVLLTNSNGASASSH